MSTRATHDTEVGDTAALRLELLNGLVNLNVSYIVRMAELGLIAERRFHAWWSARRNGNVDEGTK